MQMQMRVLARERIGRFCPGFPDIPASEGITLISRAATCDFTLSTSFPVLLAGAILPIA